jgi:ABC-type branched-subunit amino acid transport system substrate-binding protein
MTSAPNRLLRLSGNRNLLVWMFMLALIACAGPKHVVHNPPSKEQPIPPKEEQVKVFDPVTGTYVLVPRSAVKVDTIKWTEDTKSPIITDNVPEPEKPSKKNSFQISLLMPFSLSTEEEGDNFDGKINRFLQYYGGVQLAMSEVDSAGYKIALHTYDVDGTLAQTQSTLNDPSIKNSDVIVGPYDKEEIEAVASYGLKNETMVVSPWLPAFNVAEENPFFIQVNPGLSSHAEAIMSFIAANWPNKKVFLVARDNTSEINRLNLFKKSNQLNTEDLIIKDDSPELARTDLQQLLRDEGTIFILPYYAKADEGFVNSFLRKLHADKELKEVMVFGMPQWLSFSNLNPNYMESLSVHISVSTYIDPDHPQYDAFKQKYFNRFHVIPDLQAYLGYDLIKWLSTTLVTAGKDGMIGPSSVWPSGIASGFDIKPVYKNNSSASSSEMKTPLYYENTLIRILKYEGQDFHLAN